MHNSHPFTGGAPSAAVAFHEQPYTQERMREESDGAARTLNTTWETTTVCTPQRTLLMGISLLQHNSEPPLETCSLLVPSQTIHITSIDLTTGTKTRKETHETHLDMSTTWDMKRKHLKQMRGHEQTYNKYNELPSQTTKHTPSRGVGTTTSMGKVHPSILGKVLRDATKNTSFYAAAYHPTRHSASPGSFGEDCNRNAENTCHLSVPVEKRAHASSHNTG